MNNSKVIQVVNILLSASVFFIPIWPTLPPFIWAITLIYWLFFGKWTFIRPPQSYLIFLASFYILYVLGMLWSQDYAYGFRDVWIKIPMLVFPVFFSIFVIDQQTIRLVKKGFVVGCLIACLICLVNALILIHRTGDVSKLFYTDYSVLMFPAYFAMCLNLAVLLVLQELFASKEMRFQTIYTIIIVFLILNIIALSEKMALIASVVTITFYFIAEARKQRRLKNMIVKMSAFYILFIVILFFYFKSYDRFSQIPAAMKSFNTENGVPKPDKYYNSSMLRLTLWNYGWDMFKGNWLFGVGTGDIKMEEIKRMKADNFQYGIEHFETPPSQYIHVAVILGIFGLLVLLATYFVPFYFSFKSKDYLYAGFLLIYIINSTTGTVLSATSVLLFGFFNSFLFVLFERSAMQKKEVSTF